MNNQKNIVGALLIVIVIVTSALIWRSTYTNASNLTMNTPTPTPTASASVKQTPPVSVTPTEVKVSEYTSMKASLTLKFKQPMYVLDTAISSQNGYIVVSMKPIQSRKSPNGIQISYESPTIDGKGGACPKSDSLGKGWTNQKVLGQTLQFCEGTKSMFGGYLANKAAKMEYAFFIGADSTAEYAVYKDIIVHGMTMR